ncbi:Proprotein convertase P-domain [Shewanella psychrophila]|uniref:Proprotein convertase P-domain n=1 Tax=Shewanella psychrophila TaxID=225848 RepID=A0A1S6HMH9_9GAMM|nr:proprotein convertase P-domain-containing protein [Shewanella psychrophila]AQS36712.1 Proprotein convertase P-domain [Shewanella psychrophila]
MKHHFKLAAVALLVSGICGASELHFLTPLTPIQVESAGQAKDYLSQEFSREHQLAYERRGVFGHYYSFYPLIDGLPIFSVVDALGVNRGGMPFRYYQASVASLQSHIWPESELAPESDVIAQAIGIEADNFDIQGLAKGWWLTEASGIEPVWQVKVKQFKPEATFSFYIDLTHEQFLAKERTVEAYLADFTPNDLLTGNSLKALVFNPDPKTKLMDESLEQQALSETLPEAAYSRVELQDLQAVDGGFMLSGPYVKVVDLAEPVNPAPLLTGDIEWRRHDDEFVQVMAYYHLDKAQRHLQSLGYEGASQIFYSPIEIDARGGTNDQSAYSFLENRILLGVGGVPDGEDADVIWHEFGHGLMHFINNSDKGGDSGAIGEGFSDFYAGVHSFRDPQGQVFEPNVMFNWDARFGNRKPRTLDDQSAKYNPNYNYPAHQWVKDTLGDQLWSTPLFQGMRRAFESHGDEAIDDFERIVIEAMYGMGAGVRMDQLALSTLDMAARMHPEKDYAAILQQQFDQHGLILDPIELAISSVVKQQTGSVPLNLSLQNLAVAKLEAISFSFSDLPEGLVVSGDMPPITELLAGDTKAIEGQFTLALGDNLICGQKITLPVDVHYTSDIAAINHSRLALAMTIGEGAHQTATGVGGDLNDATANDVGLTKEMGVNNFYLDFSQQDFKVNQDLTLSLHIEHPQFDQLSIKLISPSGLQVDIWDRDYYPRTSFRHTLPNNVADIDWSAVIDESLTGQWQLQIIDHDAGHKGKLLSWSLSQVSEYTCSQPDVTPQPDKKTDEKTKDSGGSLGWTLWMLCFAYITRQYVKTEK